MIFRWRWRWKDFKNEHERLSVHYEHMMKALPFIKATEHANNHLSEFSFASLSDKSFRQDGFRAWIMGTCIFSLLFSSIASIIILLKRSFWKLFFLLSCFLLMATAKLVRLLVYTCSREQQETRKGWCHERWIFFRLFP